MYKAETSLRSLGALPVGVSLKSQYYQMVLERAPSIAFFEIHAENYMVDGGAHHRFLEAIVEKYPLSIHGVGMSLGSAEGISKDHIKRFRDLVDRYNPTLVSEHLAWSVEGGHYLNDLLPLPLNEETLNIVTDNVNTVQDALGRKILVENPSSYMAFNATTMPEVEFLSAISERTGCGLLMDVNNVFVSGRNMGWSPEDYIDSVPVDLIGEIHLAGHLIKDVDGVELRIDDHGSAVSDDVWALYRRLIERSGEKPSLIEWDNNIPDFDILHNEASKAQAIMADIENDSLKESA
ncbi:DUF692 domain-containing protein [Kordiimonas sp. SCSIO 12610]|uniref:MNIO family bufferin maturase n=1 Tax=Kordiimonas sp. SCSIO 12610 TaxID=2829597 RepID=UPI00210DC2F8|nr:DUF692 domain-containing protein [Kordiimonas sp. SCSIO 12610]UTW54170.1 DUF692 domain-containing protein [Kordiimonas sp. SCSIO 12610]